MTIHCCCGSQSRAPMRAQKFKASKPQSVLALAGIWAHALGVIMNRFKYSIILLIFATLAVVTHSQVIDKALISTRAMKKDTAIFIESDKVAAAFAKGSPLIENSQFKVHASRRDAPGIVEVHL